VRAHMHPVADIGLEIVLKQLAPELARRRMIRYRIISHQPYASKGVVDLGMAPLRITALA
jgi:hypothetical protein